MRTDELIRGRQGRKWLIIWVSLSLMLVLAATAVLLLLVINEFSVKIQMNGPEDVTLEYGETYEEPGAEAVLQGSMALSEGKQMTVRVQGQVPELQLGTYVITYSASFGPWRGSAVRTVHVVDTQAPRIVLFSNDYLTPPGQEYREEGYLAVDNYDGDITDQVVVTQGDGVVIYSVADSSGNTAAVIRQIRYADAE